MRKHSRNIQIKQLLQKYQPNTCELKFNEYGNFVYKDHVTRKKYEVKKLKNQIHKATKSVDNLSSVYNFQETLRQKKWELTHFLQQLVMHNHIKQNRNYIVSGNQKVQRRRSFMISLPKIDKNKNDLDQIKQKIRKQVDQINYQFLRDYLKKKMPYRGILGELNKISSTGALTSQRIKKIKNTISKCHQKENFNEKVQNNHQLAKINQKQNLQFEKYFGEAWKNLDLQIKLKVKHETAFNWKHGKRQDIDSMIKFCKQIQEKKQYQQSD